MTIEEMRRRKRELGYSYEMVAEKAGLPMGTVQKVLGGITKSPRYVTLKALERVLGSQESQGCGETKLRRKYGEHGREEKGQQGGYTLDDYYSLSGKERVELIDGVFYDSGAEYSGGLHQNVRLQIWKRFADYIDKKQKSCVSAVFPMRVQLDCDDRTLVQPDVMIVGDRKKFRQGMVLGAPELIVEVLSPATRRKDILLKSVKYEAAGVREYWIVDLAGKKVLVYDFVNEIGFGLYEFTEKVAVGIFDGECEVDFREIYEELQFLYEE